ncbi:hypothetical protein BHE74_00037911 [Ensete ventricosum]|nr:hypothetical protein BHE74_00037911 [Ensete ventricosum]
MLVGNFMERWNVDTTALDLLRVGQPIIALYVEGRSTTMKMTISVLVRGSSPIVIGRVVVPAFFDIMVVFTMETIILTLVPFLGTDFDAIWRRQESFPPYLEENLGPRGVEGRCRRSCAAEVSTAMKWFTLCIISGTVVGGFSTKDQNSLDERIPITNAWITKEGCASGIARVSAGNRLTNWASGSSLPWVMPRSEAAVGFGRVLARKFCSSSLASWSKEKMDAGLRRLYHIRAGPLKVVGKTRCMSTLDKSYSVICARKATTCSIGSELLSYDSKAGSLKLVGIGLSRISGAKGGPCLELPPASSFDLVTSSSHLFTRRSCTRSESVESDNNGSGSHGVCATPRYREVDFSGMIEGPSDWISGGSCYVGSGRASTLCSREPP